MAAQTVAPVVRTSSTMTTVLVSQLAWCTGREFEDAIDILQALRIRQLCLERCAAGLEQKATAGVALDSSAERVLQATWGK